MHIKTKRDQATKRQNEMESGPSCVHPRGASFTGRIEQKNIKRRANAALASWLTKIIEQLGPLRRILLLLLLLGLLLLLLLLLIHHLLQLRWRHELR